MKHLLTAAIVLSTATAYSYTTRARNMSLQNSPHVLDFYSPENLHMSANTLTIESGSTGAATDIYDAAGPTYKDINSSVEGTFVKSTDLGVFGITLGHQESFIYDQRLNSGIDGIDAQQNPIQFGFGTTMADFNVGAALIYSNYENKTAKEKENSMGVRLGMSNSLFYVNGLFMFADKYENETANHKYEGDLAIDVKAGYNITEEFSVHARVTNTSHENVIGGAAAVENKLMRVSATAIHNVKQENLNFFYGAGLLHVSGEAGANDVKGLALPVIVGLEANANSWLTVRASVTQDVVLSSYENYNGNTGDASSGLNTTTVAAGAGLNFGKVTVDGTLLTQTATTTNTQSINADNLLAQVGVRYNF